MEYGDNLPALGSIENRNTKIFKITESLCKQTAGTGRFSDPANCIHLSHSAINSNGRKRCAGAENDIS